MKTIIYYYTGTGNSLWTARCIAAGLGDSALFPLSRMDGNVVAEAEAVGLIFPVHMWGVPSLVLDFLKRMKNDPERYYFACAVNAGQVSRTLIQLQNQMAAMGLTLSAGFDIVLPSNYIPWGGPGPADKLDRLYIEAREKIRRIIPIIAGRRILPMEKGPLWQRIIFSVLYKMTFPMIPRMDRDFWVDEKCNGCGLCERVCPVQNIVMAAAKPSWLHHCEQCLACIQWCPQEAVQYGKKTKNYPRYHHPEIQLKDIILEPARKKTSTA